VSEEVRYNLIDEAWIPVRGQDGKSRTVGLAEVFRQAHAIRDLDEPSPANRVALYRLLLAVLHRALHARFGPWGRQERRRWRREGLPTDAVLDYLEQWRERFWLVHPEHPFMQVAALAGHPETKDKRKSVLQLALQGNDGFLFDHRDAVVLPWPLALRDMLGIFSFTPGGLIKILKTSDNAGPLANSAAFLALGANFGETLLLNLGASLPNRDDLPTWEKAPPSIQDLAAPATLASGPNDRYTRQSRGVLLDVDDGGRVRELWFAPGLALLDDPHAPDPMVAQRMSKDGKTILRIRFDGSRALWRDLPSLTADAKEKAPIVLRHAPKSPETRKSCMCLRRGLVVIEAKIERARMELLRLPHAVLAVEDAAAQLREDVARAEALHDKLRALAARVVALTQPDPEHTETPQKSP